MQTTPFFTRSLWIRWLSVLAAYAILLGLQYLTPLPAAFTALIAPAFGLALAAGLLYGMEILPALFAGSIVGHVYSGSSFPLAAGIALGEIAGVALCIALARRPLSKTQYSLDTILTSLVFIGSTLAGTALNTIIATSALFAAHLIPGSTIGYVLVARGGASGLGALVVTSYLLAWLGARSTPISRRNLLEKVAFSSVLIAVNGLFFWSFTGRSISLIPFLYLTILPLLYAGIRFGHRGKMSALMLMTASAMTGTLAGYGPFFGQPMTTALFGVDLFLGLLAFAYLLFASITEENQRSEAVLAEHTANLERALRKIRSADQAKTDFLATLAHELRNPLAPIVSALDILDQRSGHASEAATIIRTNIKTVTKLLDDLLDISRISRRKFSLTKEHMNLGDTIARAVAVVRTPLEERGHTFSLALPTEELWIHGDSTRIEQVIINLLNNAARYTERGGSVSLSCVCENDYAVIRVEDNGIGISEEMLEKIFEPFQQADSTGDGTAGLGLGLSLVRTLTELHGGTITAASRGRGRGSLFTLRLPALSRAQLPLFSPESPLGDTPRPRARDILVVDDNEAAAKGLAMLLRRAGHTVRLAHDGRTALSIARERAPHIMILDIGLPDMDGYELARRLRTNGGDTTLIALSGYGTSEDKAKADEAGFRFHITKPVGIAELEKTLARIA